MQAVNLEMDLESLVPIEVPVKYQGKQYLLKEASEGAKIEHRDGMFRVTKPNMETGKPTSMEGMARLDLELLARCLFDVSEGNPAKGIPVTAETILGWPSKVVKLLSDKLTEISGLRDEESEETLDKQITILVKQKESLSKLRVSAKN